MSSLSGIRTMSACIVVCVQDMEKRRDEVAVMKKLGQPESVSVHTARTTSGGDTSSAALFDPDTVMGTVQAAAVRS